MYAAHCIGDQLVFVNDEQARTFATQKSRALCFQRRNDDARVEIQGEIAGRDPNIPAAGAPFREFVVGERASER